VQINFGNIKVRPPFDSEEKRRELSRRLNAVPCSQLGTDIERFPSIKLAALKNPTALECFESAFDWFVEQVNLQDSSS
jgi:hypothetical protein